MTILQQVFLEPTMIYVDKEDKLYLQPQEKYVLKIPGWYFMDKDICIIIRNPIPDNSMYLVQNNTLEALTKYKIYSKNLHTNITYERIFTLKRFLAKYIQECLDKIQE